MHEDKGRIMSKYYIDPKNPDSYVTTKIYVQWDDNGDFKVLPSRCRWNQGDSPCTGNPLKPCQGSYLKCNAHSKEVCTDVIGKMQFLHKENHDHEDATAVFPPKNVTVEMAKFARETYAMRSYINTMSRRMDKTTQTMVWDQFRYEQKTLQVLLKDWTLGRLDPSLIIMPVQPPGMPFTMISKESMKTINRVSSDIIQAFIDEYRATASTV